MTINTGQERFGKFPETDMGVGWENPSSRTNSDKFPQLQETERLYASKMKGSKWFVSSALCVKCDTA